MILAIDIGSTRTHVAAVDIRKLECVDRVDLENSGFDGRFGAAAKGIANAYPQIRRANISSCVRDLSIRAKRFCVDGGMDDGGIVDDAVIIQAHDKLLADMGMTHGVGIIPSLSVEFKYDNPQTLGTDRVCNALACAALFKGEDCIIIDSGTAITVDFLKGGKTFEGGAILPGCAMQAKALCAGTDVLPEVNLYGVDGVDGGIVVDIVDGGDNQVNTDAIINKNGGDGGDNQISTDTIINKNITISLPAISSTACITSGILYGTAGAVTRCVDECLRGGGGMDNTRIVATGGGWGIIKSLVNHTVTTVPDLTLIGAGIFRSN